MLRLLPASLRTALVLLCLVSLAPATRGAEDDLSKVSQDVDTALEALGALQEQLVQLLMRGPTDEQAEALALRVEREMSGIHSQLKSLTGKLIAAAANDGAQTEEQESLFTDAETRAAQAAEESVFRIFRIRHTRAATVAQTVHQVVRDRSVRVAVDEASNSMVVAGNERSVNEVTALVEELDIEPNDPLSAAVAETEEARSLMVRIYWLADGLAEDEGEPPVGPLPQSVVDAVGKLGLNNPRLVAQTVNSLSRDADPEHKVRFESRVPALHSKRPVQLRCVGDVWPIRNNRVGMVVNIDTSGLLMDTELGGSVSAPLGHYMVLGTANSVADRSGASDRRERIRMLREQQEAEREQEQQRGGGLDGGSRFSEAGDVPEPSYATSHFAFVIQVVEAESFAAEK